MASAWREMRRQPAPIQAFSAEGRLPQSLHSEDLDNPAKLEVRAELLGTPEAPAQLERLVSRVSLEKGVSSVRWQVFELAAD